MELRKIDAVMTVSPANLGLGPLRMHGSFTSTLRTRPWGCMAYLYTGLYPRFWVLEPGTFWYHCGTNIGRVYVEATESSIIRAQQIRRTYVVDELVGDITPCTFVVRAQRLLGQRSLSVL